jgi:O-antigen ligase
MTAAGEKQGLALVNRQWLAMWLVFFLSPFLWPYIHSTATAFSLLALATGLGAAAAMWQPEWRDTKGLDLLPWLWLTCLLLPGCLLLLSGQVRNPWNFWLQSLFMTACWLVFIFSRAQASRLVSSRAWALLLAIVTHLYVAYAVMQWLDIRPFQDALAGSLFPFWSGAWQVKSFAGPLAQQNLHGLFLCLVLMALYCRVVDSLSDRWWLWWLMCLLPSMNLIATGSRGSFVVFVIGLGLIIFASQLRKQAIIRILSCLLIAALLYWLLLELRTANLEASAGISNRTLAEAFQQRGFTARLFIWDLCFRIFMQHPWLGVGWGNLASYGAEGQALVLHARPEWADRALNVQYIWAHNTVLQFLVEAGLMGAVAILVLYAAVIRRFIKLMRHGVRLTNGVFQGCLGCGLILIHGLVSVSVFNVFFMVLFGLYAASAFPLKGGKTS